jgi:protein phosphatase/serine/threonine-protein phosphatase Stp1
MTTLVLAEGTAMSFACSVAARRSPDRGISQDAHFLNPEAGVFLVADGLGGHEDGEIASRAVAEIVRRVVAPGQSLAERCRAIEAALHAINRALRREAARRSGSAVVGSTVALVVFGDDSLIGMWVGDSRIYLLRDGALVQLTRDHTFTAELGIASPRGQALTRAIGSGDDLRVDRFACPIADGDTLLLCSDGITKVLGDGVIAGLMHEPVGGLAERVLARAVVAGGRDDMTAILVRVWCLVEPDRRSLEKGRR